MVHQITDVTGTGSSLPLSVSTLPVFWVQIIASSSNAAAVRVGDSQVSASKGLSLPAGSGQMFPPTNAGRWAYDLSKIYVLAQTGDKVSVAYET